MPNLTEQQEIELIDNAIDSLISESIESHITHKSETPCESYRVYSMMGKTKFRELVQGMEEIMVEDLKNQGKLDLNAIAQIAVISYRVGLRVAKSQVMEKIFT